MAVFVCIVIGSDLDDIPITSEPEEAGLPQLPVVSEELQQPVEIRHDCDPTPTPVDELVCGSPLPNNLTTSDQPPEPTQAELDLLQFFFWS